MSKRDVERKCERVIRLILEKVNTTGTNLPDGPRVIFEADWGGNSMTVSITAEGHTHVGIPEESFEFMVDGLIAALGGGGVGLSFVNTEETPNA